MELFLMCGAPGAGKTTILNKEVMTAKSPYARIVSRDLIRFHLLEESDEYFDKESQVFKEYARQIQNFIDDEAVTSVFCDATHLTENSRNKLLDKLDLKKVGSVNILVLHPSLEECLARNESREGIKKVPRGQIRRMWLSFEFPKFEEKYGKLYNIYIWNEKDECWNKFPPTESNFDEMLL